MSDILEQEAEGSDKIKAWIIALFFLFLGYLGGASIEGDRKEKAALDWAVLTTRECETSSQPEGERDVAECLAGAIADVEAEQQAERQAEGVHPR